MFKVSLVTLSFSYHLFVYSNEWETVSHKQIQILYTILKLTGLAVIALGELKWLWLLESCFNLGERGKRFHDFLESI